MTARDERLRLMKQGQALHSPLADQPATELALIEMGLRAETGTLDAAEVNRLEERVKALREQVTQREAAQEKKTERDLVTNGDRFAMWFEKQGMGQQDDPVLAAIGQAGHDQRDKRYDVLDEASQAGGDVLAQLFENALTDEEREMRAQAKAEETQRKRALGRAERELERWSALSDAERREEWQKEWQQRQREAARAKQAARHTPDDAA